MDNVKVSVCMITYNHEGFIKEAMQGVLKQETDFNIEFIIANDSSTDKTHEIISRLAKSTNRITIKYFAHDKNLGMIPNFVFALKKCTSKYIALCEGDDYWIDSLKLQKQVDFLENEICFTGVATNSKVIYENSEKKSHLFGKEVCRSLDIHDLLEARLFHTATFMFRKEHYKTDFPLNILSADRALFMLVACFGKIKLFNSVTAVYRKNEGGISRNVTSKQMKRDFKIAAYIQKYNNAFNVNKLKVFLSNTVLMYSHKLFFSDFVKYSTYFLWYNMLNKKGIKSKIKSVINNFRYIKTYFKKVDFRN